VKYWGKESISLILAFLNGLAAVLPEKSAENSMNIGK
jgi:hypothetical protein